VPGAVQLVGTVGGEASVGDGGSGVDAVAAGKYTATGV
jgi:hypothetical protein